MMGAGTRIVDNSGKVVKAADRATYENIRHAAFSIGKAARGSIDKSPEASLPGEPPHTRGGQAGIKRAIRVGMEDKDSAVVGTMHSAFGPAGEVLEHGGERFDTHIEARSFMTPALEANLDRFAGSFGGSVGE